MMKMMTMRMGIGISHSPFVFVRIAAMSTTKHGFSRSEMYKENLGGSVDAYDRHVFLCYNNPRSWLPRVEASHPLPNSLTKPFKARQNHIPLKTKFTVCEAREEDGFSNGDVLIFPDMIKYRGLEESKVDGFFDDVMVRGEIWSGGVPDPLIGSHIFVCAHGSRDVRCGECAPALIHKFNHEIKLRGLNNHISVLACSHIGGHKYAGNIIIYSPTPDGNITGHWYGYVTPNDVPAFLDQHIANGQLIQKLWRGQMGPPVAKAQGSDDQKLVNGDVEKNHAESNNLSSNESVVDCCQGVNGVSCCTNST